MINFKEKITMNLSFGEINYLIFINFKYVKPILFIFTNIISEIKNMLIIKKKS